MIELYSGTPGSGKSYHAIQRIFNNLRMRRFVISNFPVTFSAKEIKKGYADRFFFMKNEEITVESLIVFAVEHGMVEKHKENQCFVVIDEAGGRYNSREFGRSDRREWIDFFSQHRKFGFTFLLVAQNDRMLDRQIRGYIEYEFMHRLINNFGPLFVLPWKVFIAVEYWYTIRQKVGSEFILFRLKKASRYDHMALFSGFTFSPEIVAKIESARSKGEKVQTGMNKPVDAIFKAEEDVAG